MREGCRGLRIENKKVRVNKVKMVKSSEKAKEGKKCVCKK